MTSPAPETNQAETKSKRYRVVAVSLYTREADWVDEMVDLLRRSGNPKANRSLVVREAILRLQEELKAKDPSEVLRDFIDHHATRTKSAK